MEKPTNYKQTNLNGFLKIKQENDIHSVIPEVKSEPGQNMIQNRSFQFKLKECKVFIKKMKDYKKFQKKKKVLKPVHCTVCDKLISCRGNLIIHMRKHTGEKPYKCRSCGVRFAYGTSFKNHMISHPECKEDEQEGKVFRKSKPAVTTNDLKNPCLTIRNTSEKTQVNRESESTSEPNSTSSERKNLKSKTSTVCPVCDKTFARIDGLRTHMRIHNGEKPYQCHICRMHFRYNQSLKKHIAKHSKWRNVISVEKFILGKKDSKSRKDLKDRENLTKLEVGQLQPPSIEMKSSSTESSNNKKNAPVQCSVCKKMISCRSSLKIHMRIHTGEKPYKCKMCDKSFSQNCSLKSHTALHTGEKKYSCDGCKKRFVQHISFKLHMKKCGKFSGQETNNTLTPPAVQVESKGNEFSSDTQQDDNNGLKLKDEVQNREQLKTIKADGYNSASYTEHENQVKNLDPKNKRDFSAPEATCESKEDTEQPKENTDQDKIESNNVNTQLTCPVCYRKFTSQQYIKVHLLGHLGLKPHSCKCCNKSFRQKSNLITHMKTAHLHNKSRRTILKQNDVHSSNKSKPKGKSFKRKRALKGHSENYVTSKSQPSSTLSGQNLECSRENPHLPEYRDINKGYEIIDKSKNKGVSSQSVRCKVCQKVVKLVSWKVHFRQHTGEKPFSCHFCKKSFAQKNGLNYHLKRYHKKKSKEKRRKEVRPRENVSSPERNLVEKVTSKSIKFESSVKTEYEIGNDLKNSQQTGEAKSIKQEEIKHNDIKPLAFQSEMNFGVHYFTENQQKLNENYQYSNAHEFYDTEYPGDLQSQIKIKSEDQQASTSHYSVYGDEGYKKEEIWTDHLVDSDCDLDIHESKPDIDNLYNLPEQQIDAEMSDDEELEITDDEEVEITDDEEVEITDDDADVPENMNIPEPVELLPPQVQENAGDVDNSFVRRDLTTEEAIAFFS